MAQRPPYNTGNQLINLQKRLLSKPEQDYKKYIKILQQMALRLDIPWTDDPKNFLHMLNVTFQRDPISVDMRLSEEQRSSQITLKTLAKGYAQLLIEKSENNSMQLTLRPHDTRVLEGFHKGFASALGPKIQEVFINDIASIENKYGTITQLQSTITKFAKQSKDAFMVKLDLSKQSDFDTQKYVRYLNLMVEFIALTNLDPKTALNSEIKDYLKLVNLMKNYQTLLESTQYLRNNTVLKVHKQNLKIVKDAFLEITQNYNSQSSLNSSLKEIIKDEFEREKKDYEDETTAIQNIKDESLEIRIKDSIRRRLEAIESTLHLIPNHKVEGSRIYEVIPEFGDFAKEHNDFDIVKAILTQEVLGALTTGNRKDLERRIDRHKVLLERSSFNQEDNNQNAGVVEKNIIKDSLAVELTSLKKAAEEFGVSPSTLKELKQALKENQEIYATGPLSKIKASFANFKRSLRTSDSLDPVDQRTDNESLIHPENNDDSGYVTVRDIEGQTLNIPRQRAASTLTVYETVPRDRATSSAPTLYEKMDDDDELQMPSETENDLARRRAGSGISTTSTLKNFSLGSSSSVETVIPPDGRSNFSGGS